MLAFEASTWVALALVPILLHAVDGSLTVAAFVPLVQWSLIAALGLLAWRCRGRLAVRVFPARASLHADDGGDGGEAQSLGSRLDPGSSDDVLAIACLCLGFSYALGAVVFATNAFTGQPGPWEALINSGHFLPAAAALWMARRLRQHRSSPTSNGEDGALVAMRVRDWAVLAIAALGLHSALSSLLGVSSALTSLVEDYFDRLLANPQQGSAARSMSVDLADFTPLVMTGLGLLLWGLRGQLGGVVSAWLEARRERDSASSQASLRSTVTVRLDEAQCVGIVAVAMLSGLWAASQALSSWAVLDNQLRGTASFVAELIALLLSVFLLVRCRSVSDWLWRRHDAQRSLTLEPRVVFCCGAACIFLAHLTAAIYTGVAGWSGWLPGVYFPPTLETADDRIWVCIKATIATVLPFALYLACLRFDALLGFERSESRAERRRNLLLCAVLLPALFHGHSAVQAAARHVFDVPGQGLALSDAPALLGILLALPLARMLAPCLKVIELQEQPN